MGIPIRVNITLLLFIPVIVWIIATDITSQQGIDWVTAIAAISPHTLEAEALQAGLMPWILGFGAALGLFFGVAVHELGHSWVARRYDLGITSITLWIFGGMAQMESNPREWRTEFWMALAGPVTSVLVGLTFYLLLLLVPSSLPSLVFVVGWLAVMNVVLAAFNLVPAFPMDGGRILRALLARNRGYAEATRMAADVGKLLAILMGIVGVLGFNPILILIALFVYIAAASESRITTMQEVLEGVKVRDLMTRDVKTVSPSTSVRELTDRMLEERHTGYPVVDGDEVVGIVTLTDVKEVSEVERDAVLVEDIMTRDVISVEPGDDAFGVLQKLGRNDVGRVIVKADGDMIGIISRTDLMTALDVLKDGGRHRDRSIPQVSH